MVALKDDTIFTTNNGSDDILNPTSTVMEEALWQEAVNYVIDNRTTISKTLFHIGCCLNTSWIYDWMLMGIICLIFLYFTHLFRRTVGKFLENIAGFVMVSAMYRIYCTTEMMVYILTKGSGVDTAKYTYDLGIFLMEISIIILTNYLTAFYIYKMKRGLKKILVVNLVSTGVTFGILFLMKNPPDSESGIVDLYWLVAGQLSFSFFTSSILPTIYNVMTFFRLEQEVGEIPPEPRSKLSFLFKLFLA